MALKVNEIKAIEKMSPLISVVCRQRKEQWVSDGTLLYRLSADDSVQATPTQTLEVDTQRFDSLMGAINLSDTVEATGFVFDAHLEQGNKSVALMIHTSGKVKSVFLVDTDLLKKVKPKKGETFVVGVKDEKRVLYNSTRTVGCLCIDDSFFSSLMDKYDDMFMALDLMRMTSGTSLTK